MVLLGYPTMNGLRWVVLLLITLLSISSCFLKRECTFWCSKAQNIHLGEIKWLIGLMGALPYSSLNLHLLPLFIFPFLAIYHNEELNPIWLGLYMYTYLYSMLAFCFFTKCVLWFDYPYLDI